MQQEQKPFVEAPEGIVIGVAPLNQNNEVSAPSFRGLGKLMPVRQTDFLTSILF